MLEEGDLVLEKIHMKENLIDMLTKIVSGASLTIIRTYFISF